MPVIQLFLSFLRNKTLREKWIKNIHHDYFEVDDKTIVYIHHFENKSEMMEAHFIKDEREWSTDEEESSNMDPVQIKVEPDLLFPEDEENGQEVKRELESQEVLSEDDSEERDITEKLLNDFRTSPQREEMGRSCHTTNEETILPYDESISMNWNCHVCGETFQEEFILKNHLSFHKDIHSSSGDLLSCDRCDKTFTHNHEFNNHMASHKGNAVHECSTCGKTFSKRSNLYRHLAGHTGEKSHSCDTCGRAFARRSNLERHMLTHTGDRQYPCNTCGKFFLQRSHLKTHVLTHKNERPYKCTTCPKTFVCQSHLKTHMSTHTGQRRHSCSECGKAFFHQSNLKAHVLTHLRKFNRPSS